MTLPRNRTTAIASRTIATAVILLGTAGSAFATSARFNQSSNATALPQPSSPAPTEADTCGPVVSIGGPVRPPVAVHTPDPKFTKEARDAKFSGNVIVGLIVDRYGRPCNVHLVRGVGMMGLDESAINAVQHYKFKPATQNGNPVAVRLNVEVNFQYQ